MSAIIDKLNSLGISPEIISELQTKAGDSLEGELVQNWLKAVATKFGIDATNLPDVDFKNLTEATQELMGTDVDGDGKTGISEAVENVQEALKNTDMEGVKEFAIQNKDGIMSKIKGFFGL